MLRDGLMPGARAGGRRPAPPRREVPEARPADDRLGRGDAGPVSRHPDPQRGRTDRALHGHRQQDRLAIDTHRNAVRAGRHLNGPGGQHAKAIGVPAAEQADRLPHAVDRHGDDAEHTAVQPRATAKARYVPRSVRVAGHQQRLRPINRHAIRECREPRPPVAVQQVRQRVQGRAELVVTVRGCLYHLGVGAERRVVDERPATDHAEVDMQFDAIRERAQAGRRVRAVQAQVQGEVVPGARGDHHEGDAVLSGDTGHQRLGAVAAGDTEQVAARRDRLPRHLRHVDRPGTAHQEHLRPQRLGFALQVELRHLPAAGPRVHDQERVAGRRRPELGHPPVRHVRGQCRAPRRAGEQPARRRRQRHPQQIGERVHHDHRQRREDEHRQRKPAQDAPAGQHQEGGRQAYRGGGHAHPEHRGALHSREEQHHRDREERQSETEPSQPALRARALGANSGAIRRHAGHPFIVSRRRPGHVTRPG
jgi:hypothetical protein